MKPESQRLLVLAALSGLGYGIYRMHADPSISNATASLYPPGYYWAYVSQRPADQPAIAKYFKDHKGKLFTRSTVSPGMHTPSDYFNKDLPSAWILFEAKEPFAWTLPGRPSIAPKGAATQIRDVLGDEQMLPAITSPEHPFNKFWGAFWSDGSDGKDPNPVLAVWSSLGTAGPILVYGATGVLLLKLWTLLPSGKSSSGKSPSARRAPPPSRHRALPRG